MAMLLNDIAWDEQIVPAVPDPAWEAEARRRRGMSAVGDRLVAPLPWLREFCLYATTFQATAMPVRLINFGAMVTSQENACRYCYGVQRAFLKILGYSEDFIDKLEREMHLAELDDAERAFLRFCRSLARSRPRPARAERDALVAAGYSPLAVNEMALMIALFCFYNRIGVLTACPPEKGIEGAAGGVLGRVLRLVSPLLRRVAASRQRGVATADDDAATLAQSPFGRILVPLAGLPGASHFRRALEGAFASPALSREVKGLMFAVVARTLDCSHCEAESRALLDGFGIGADEFETIVATLDAPRLGPGEASLLSWVRDTVHYQTGPVQAHTRAVLAQLPPQAGLEAIGIASLANGTVRLAMLLE
ncbi:MAG: hypothetical protein JNM90_15980 [Burkholderiales bacterium]|nr:hypothetical protein [Burkholderiales bacterium]